MKISLLPTKILALVLLLSSSASFAAGSAFHYKLDLTVCLVSIDTGELTGVEHIE